MHSVRCLAPITNASATTMPGIEKLPIEETLEDSPQVTTSSSLEASADMLTLANCTARLAVFVGSVFANNQGRDDKFKQHANR